jgi:hypothetical protein
MIYKSVLKIMERDHKKKPSKNPKKILDGMCFKNCDDYSPATIAPIGQASAHVPQSMQAFGSIV